MFSIYCFSIEKKYVLFMSTAVFLANLLLEKIVYKFVTKSALILKIVGSILESYEVWCRLKKCNIF